MPTLQVLALRQILGVLTGSLVTRLKWAVRSSYGWRCQVAISNV